MLHRCSSRFCGGGAAAAGGTGRHTTSNKATMSIGIDPMKLNLSLDLGNMDFVKVVQATRSAVAAETKMREVVNFTVDVVGVGDAKAAPGPRAEPGLSDPVRGERSDGATRGARTVRGIVRGGAVHDASPGDQVQLARRQARQEGFRQTLADMLREYALIGNWSRAFLLFENALRLYPPFPTSSSSRGSPDAAADLYGEKRLDVLRGVLAISSPPEAHSTCEKGASAADDSTAVEEDVDMRNGYGQQQQNAMYDRMRIRGPRGLVRWNGLHYYLLLKVLLIKDRYAEAEKVWLVMRKIGFFDISMDSRTANALIRLASQQKQHKPAAELTELFLRNQDHLRSLHEQRTRILQDILHDVERAAQKRDLQLETRNQRVISSLRIASALHRAEHGDTALKEGEVNVRAAGNQGLDGFDQSQEEERDKDGDLQGEGVRVGDFNELLRRASSESSTVRVLNMMKKLGLERNATTHACIMYSLRNPRYILESVENTEKASGNSGAGEDCETTGHAISNNAVSASDVEKKMRSANRRQHVERAREWFDACAPEARNADLFNEMLFFYRPRGYEAEFEEILTEFRGTPLPCPLEVTSGKCPSAIHPLFKWRVPPNGRTFELIIRRYHFFGASECCWHVYDEMLGMGINGTARLFEELLQVARRTPPPGKASDGVVLSLYDEMRRQCVDVTSIRATLSLVNAWSSTRRRTKRM